VGVADDPNRGGKRSIGDSVATIAERLVKKPSPQIKSVSAA
jgi:hypothetical protein